jgi:hypothetical protein
MLLKDHPEPVGEDPELLGPGQGGVELAVDLGEDVVKDQIVELLFVADMVVERAGDHPKAGGQAAHGQRLGAVGGDDRRRLGDHPRAGELGAAVLVVEGRVEPQRGCPAVGRTIAGRCRFPRGERGLLPLLHWPSFER